MFIVSLNEITQMLSCIYPENVSFYIGVYAGIFFYRSVSYTRTQWILNPQPHPPGPPPILVEERSVI